MRRYTGPPVELPGYYSLPDRELAWYDLRLALAVHQTNEERRVDKPVKDLAGTVKEAINALAGVGPAAQRLKTIALKVSGQVDSVNALSDNLEGASAALEAVVGQATAQPMTNGAPAGPLPGQETSETPPTPQPQPSPPLDPEPPTLTLQQSLKAVESANA